MRTCATSMTVFCRWTPSTTTAGQMSPALTTILRAPWASPTVTLKSTSGSPPRSRFPFATALALFRDSTPPSAEAITTLTLSGGRRTSPPRCRSSLGGQKHAPFGRAISAWVDSSLNRARRRIGNHHQRPVSHLDQLLSGPDGLPSLSSILVVRALCGRSDRSEEHTSELQSLR